MAGFTEKDAEAIRAMVDTHLQAILDHNPGAFLEPARTTSLSCRPSFPLWWARMPVVRI